MLQAPTVTAQIRLRSLWRGRLRVSRISLDEPSVNVTRGPDGRWSLQNLLVTAAQATNQAENDARASDFPYIESTNARVNLKLGAEKTPFSLEDVDLAWSRVSPRRWRVRLKGRPVRTDIEVRDSGALRVEGNVTGAASLDDVELDLNANWDQLQLGELTRLVHRSDAGWRGDVELQSTVKGAIRDLDIATQARIYGLRRTEFVPATSIDPVLNCTARFAHSAAMLHDVSCILPVEKPASRVEAHGTVSLAAPVSRSDLTIDLDAIPAAALLEAARHARQNLAQDMRADGEANGSFRWDGAAWHGSAIVPRLTLSASDAKAPMILTAVRVAVGDSPVGVAQHVKKSAKRAGRRPPPSPVFADNVWHLDPVQIDLGAPKPLIVSGTATGSGYTLRWSGNAAWNRLMVLTKLSPGLRAALRVDNFAPPEAGAPEADADMDLTLRAPWSVDAARYAQVLGTLRARNLSVISPLLRQPVEIPNAAAKFTAEQTLWSGVARYAGTRIEGDVTLPTHCLQDSECAGRFALRAQQLDLAAAIAAGQPRSSEPVLAFLERLRPSNPGAPWPTLSGTIHVDTFTAGSLVLHDGDAQLEIAHRTATIKAMNGRALGGTLTLDGLVNATESTPNYKLHFTLHHVDTSLAATLFHESWSLGAGDVEANISSRANSPRDLASNTTGDFRFDLQQGALRSETTTMPFDHWSGTGSIADRKLTLQNSTMSRGASRLPVTGMIGFDRGLQLRIGDGNDATVVAGTISEPVISKP
jgi:AsmA protein